MTETEWLTSDNPAAMIAHIIPNASARKLRLSATNCCRQVWDQFTDDSQCLNCGGAGRRATYYWHSCSPCSGTGRINRSRRAVEVAEQFADGLATADELHRAWLSATYAFEELNRPFEAEIAAICAGEIGRITMNSGLPRWFSVSTKFAATQAALLRDIFGNPWRRHFIADHTYLSDNRETGRQIFSDRWLSSTVVSLAKAIYDERAFDRMPFLGDALEDAGCTDAGVLNHCRANVSRTVAEVMAAASSVVGCCDRNADNMACDCIELAVGNIGPHVRGCWVVDLILGKE